MNKPDLTDEKSKIQIMQYLLEKEDYKKAKEIAVEVMKESYYTYHYPYRKEIDECFYILAENGDIESMLINLKRVEKRHHAYTETFHYTDALAKEGYIHAFAKLGSHYELGIGCIKDKKLALDNFLKGIIFSDDENAYNGYRRMLSQARINQDKLTEPVQKLLKEGVVLSWQVYMSNQIFAGRIKEFPPSFAYPVYKKLFLKGAIPGWKQEDTDKVEATFNLIHCLIFGIGTKKNEFAALYVLQETDPWFYWDEMDAMWWEEYCNVFSETEDARNHFDDQIYANEQVKKWIRTEEAFLLSPGEEKPVFFIEPDENYYFNEKWTEKIETMMEEV